MYFSARTAALAYDGSEHSFGSIIRERATKSNTPPYPSVLICPPTSTADLKRTLDFSTELCANYSLVLSIKNVIHGVAIRNPEWPILLLTALRRGIGIDMVTCMKTHEKSTLYSESTDRHLAFYMGDVLVTDTPIAAVKS